jgi:hypothetical protein
VTEGNENRVVAEEKLYVTGSNLPKKDRSSVTVVNKESLEEAQRAAPASVVPGAGQ